MAITVGEAYERGDRALTPHAGKPEAEARDAAMAYIEELLGIDIEEWKVGAEGEVLALILSGTRPAVAGIALLSSFAAGVEWQREREDA